MPYITGSSIQIDFGQPLVEKWRAEDAVEVERTIVPRIAGHGKEWTADTGAWDAARVVDRLTGNVPATEFRIFHDDDGIFIRVHNHFRQEHEPDAILRDHGNIRWGEDEVVEIRLRAPTDVRGAQRPLYHFAVSAGGTRYEARDENPIYSPDWEAHVERSASTWTAWIRIPFAAIEHERPPSELEINLGRYGPGVAAQSWGPDYRQTRERTIRLEGIDRPQFDHAEIGKAGDRPAPVDGIRTGEGIALDWITGVARAQDRWIEGQLLLNETLLRDGDTVEVSLWEPGGRSPIDEVEAVVERRSAHIRVDLRRWGLAAGRVEANLIRNGDVIGHATSLLSALPLPAAYEDGFRIPLRINIPDGLDAESPWPLYIGVPFPAGHVWQAQGWAVEDASGHRYPTQLEAVAFWAPQGSIQWMRVDTVCEPHAELHLVYRPETSPVMPAHPVSVKEEGDRIILGNGIASYTIGTGGSPIEEIRLDGARVAGTSDTRGLYLVDQRGRLATARDSESNIRIESAGPVAASVRIEGNYITTDAGEPVARHITRIELSADSTAARVTHTLVLTRDTNEIWFEEAGWEFDVTPGADPEALFAVSRSEPDRSVSIRLADPNDEAYLLQERHVRFSGGENTSRLVHNGETLDSGTRIGDWFMLQNDAAGLAISCRESARQHPKEFVARGNHRMTLKLFSPRTGEAIDFRTGTLVERWNLQHLAEGRRTPEQAAAFVEEIKAIPSNALGWAKTHEILLAPAVQRRQPSAVAGPSWWHSQPVFAIAEPAWLYQSRAMGALHPRDPQRFPEAESRIQSVIENFHARAETQGMRGFVDYEAGPPFRYGGQFFRWGLTYTLRADAWRVFARSGDRTAFNFATKTNRAWGDNYLASWGDEHKVHGLYTQGVRGTEAPNLPFYWGDHTFTNIRSSTNLNQLLWDYYLTGYRRAADQVEDFAQGLMTHLAPAVIRRDRRIIMTFRAVLQCYGFTWDPTLREMAQALADEFEDRDSEVGITKNRPLASSTYKTGMDIRALIEAWELFGHPRYRRMVDRLGRYLLRVEMGTHPISYTNPLGLVGADLWHQTRDPALAQLLLLHMRWANAEIDQSIGSPHAVTFLLEGVPAIQDVIARTNVDRQPSAAWAGATHYEGEVSFFFAKADRESTRLHLKTPSGIGRENPRMEALHPGRGIDLAHGGFKQQDYGEWTAPLDAPEGVFRVTPAPPSGSANHLAILSKPEAMVLFAPGYWMPFPPQLPAPKWYFNVPEEAENPAIFFEGATTLYTPDGQVWYESGAAAEWVKLPDTPAGLWSFTVHGTGAVRVRNLPPFFAAESPGNWCAPEFDWEKHAMAVPAETIGFPDQSAFVSGLPGLPEHRAFFIAPGDTLSLEGAPPGATDSDHSRLPFREGTIEFWVRPAWGSFMLDGDTVTLLRMPAHGRRWDLDFHRQTAQFTHALYAYAIGQDEHGSERSFRSWRPFTMIEPGEWVHIALTWGQGAGTRPGMQHELTFGIYVNGKAGMQTHFAGNEGRHPAHAPQRLVFPGLNAAISQLRVSDVIRYHDDFTPPVWGPDEPQDEHTHFWFSLDNTLEGQTRHGPARLVQASP